MPSSISTLLTLTLTLLLSLSLALSSEIDDLLAVDAELEREGETPPNPSDDPGVLRRAQSVVVDLNDQNARGVVDGDEYVMVLGYAPWDERSAEMMPSFAEAAVVLREMGSPVVMAKLDAERFGKAARAFGIRGFPTLLLFVNGSSKAYRGGYTMEEIVIWARKNTGSPTIKLTSVVAAKEFLAKYQKFMIGLFGNSEGLEHEEFVKAAASDEDIQFVETDDIHIAEVLFPHLSKEDNFIGLVKSEPERFVRFDESFEKEKILKFIEYNKFPLVTTMTELNSARIYSSAVKIQVFLIAESDDFKQLALLLQDAARKYKTKILFVYVDATEDNLAKPFLTLFGIEVERPKVVAFNSNVGTKYFLEMDITANNLDEFCLGILQGTLAPHFRSEPIPDSKEIVEKVVGKTFDAKVLESSDNVVLEVYSQWCMDCEATTKQIQKLAKHFRGRSDLIFARIDASANEHPKLEINTYPTIIFYPSGDKSNPVKISKKSNLKDMIDFLQKSLKSEDIKDNSSKDEL